MSEEFDLHEDTKKYIAELTRMAGQMMQYGIQQTCQNIIDSYAQLGLNVSVTYGQMEYEIDFDGDDIIELDKKFREYRFDLEPKADFVKKWEDLWNKKL